jgi:hypothetical protein
MYSKFFPDGFDGLPFSPRDLHTALRWVQTHPDARMRLTAFGISGIIEIYPPGWSCPRWCLWQSQDGRLQLDDIAMSEYGLPYPTFDMALRFIALSLAADSC